MLQASTFLEAVRRRGFDFFTGVPCSFLTPVIDCVISDPGAAYVGAGSEGEAVAIAAGAWLAGRRTVVMYQNSGLGNAVNPLTSLNHPFRIPTLLIVTWRGEPGLKDEPQHELMGQITHRLLDTIGVGHLPFPAEDDEVERVLDQAAAALAVHDQPFALVMRKGTVTGEALTQPAAKLRGPGRRHDHVAGAAQPARVAVLDRVLTAVPPSAAIIATTGKCGRELYTLADRPQHLYQVGSMGCASGMGLGVALHTKRPVVVLDGDGAALMKMGTLATIGAYAPENLIDVVLDNGVHDSTGGQRTASTTVDFAGVALACGFAVAALCDSLTGFEVALSRALELPGPHLIHMRISPGSMANLGRPQIKPHEVARRFQSFLRNI